MQCQHTGLRNLCSPSIMGSNAHCASRSRWGPEVLFSREINKVYKKQKKATMYCMYTVLLQDIDVSDQAAVDKFLLDLDGTKNKGKKLPICQEIFYF